MRNYCIFCGSKLIGGNCNCIEYVNYYGVAPAPAPIPTPPVSPAADPMIVQDQPTIYMPTPASAPAPMPVPAPAPAPRPTPRPTPAKDSAFKSAGDL